MQGDVRVLFVLKRYSQWRCYGLDGPRIDSRWWPRFSASVQTGSDAHSATYTMGTGTFLGVKRPGRGVDHPPHLVPRLKKE
jgi:hypothetical protein